MTMHEEEKGSHAAWVHRVWAEYPPELPYIKVLEWVLNESFEECRRLREGHRGEGRAAPVGDGGVGNGQGEERA